MSANNKRIMIVFMLVLITCMHYFVDGNRLVSHILHRELYFIPIALAAYWFGKKWGLSVAVLCSILFLPRFFLMKHISDAFSISNILEIPVYLLVGFLIGHIQDVRNVHWRSLITTPETPEPESSLKHKRRVLLCIYNTPNVSKIARYIMDTLTKKTSYPSTS